MSRTLKVRLVVLAVALGIVELLALLNMAGGIDRRGEAFANPPATSATLPKHV